MGGGGDGAGSVNGTGQSKAIQLDGQFPSPGGLRGDDDVIGPNIPMGHSTLMTMGQGIADLDDHINDQIRPTTEGASSQSFLKVILPSVADQEPSWWDIGTVWGDLGGTMASHDPMMTLAPGEHKALMLTPRLGGDMGDIIGEACGGGGGSIPGGAGGGLDRGG